MTLIQRSDHDIAATENVGSTTGPANCFPAGSGDCGQTAEPAYAHLCQVHDVAGGQPGQQPAGMADRIHTAAVNHRDRDAANAGCIYGQQGVRSQLTWIPFGYIS